MNHLRRLMEEVVPEREQDPRTLRKLAQARHIIQHHGNFTSAILISKGGKVAIGVAKRNPRDDPMNADRGMKIALVRAYRNLGEWGWQ